MRYHKIVGEDKSRRNDETIGNILQMMRRGPTKEEEDCLNMEESKLDSEYNAFEEYMRKLNLDSS